MDARTRHRRAVVSTAIDATVESSRAATSSLPGVDQSDGSAEAGGGGPTVTDASQPYVLPATRSCEAIR